MASTEQTLTDSDSDTTPCLDEVEAILGYEFRDKALLEEAFTDPSAPDCLATYERLEFVGDSVLGMLVIKEQFLKYPDLPPGVLTRLRAANVDTEKLARAALKHGLYRYFRHNKPLLCQQIEEFKEGVLSYPLHSYGLIDVPKALADIVESSIGAVFLDSGSNLDTVWKVFRPLLEPIIEPEDLKPHPMTVLYETCQKSRTKIEEFKGVLSYPLHSYGLIDVPKALADIMESSIGVVFLDLGSNLDTVWKVFRPLLEPIIEPEDLKPHPMTALYETCQKSRRKVKFVDKWVESMSFIVYMDDQLVGTGEYKSKKEIAQNRAAKNALENLNKIFGSNLHTPIDV